MHKKILTINGSIVFFLSLAFFYFLLKASFSTDYFVTDTQIHSLWLLKINYGLESYPPNFMYHIIVNTLSFYSKDLFIIYLSSTFALALSVVAKFEITKEILRETTGDLYKNRILIIAVAFGLIVFFPIQDYFGLTFFNRYYIGKVTPNVWHNSTTIFLIPFALMLFWLQYKELVSKTPVSKSTLVKITILIIFNILIKPSFFFVYAPVSALLLWKKYGLGKQYIKNIIPILIGLPVLYFMHRILFILQAGGYANNEGGLILSKPFEAWLHFAPVWYLPITFIHSFALPISYAILYRKDFIKNKMIIYASLLTVFGLLISILFIEDGPRKYHGNLMWQNVICSYLLMLSVSACIMKKYLLEGMKSLKMKILGVVFFLHTATGVIYIIRLLKEKNIS